VDVQCSNFCSLLEDRFPFVGSQLRFGGYHLQGIRTVRAMQGTAMRDFCDERQRWVERQKSTSRFC
jgi:hypothetical protein